MSKKVALDLGTEQGHLDKCETKTRQIKWLTLRKYIRRHQRQKGRKMKCSQQHNDTEVKAKKSVSIANSTKSSIKKLTCVIEPRTAT